MQFANSLKKTPLHLAMSAALLTMSGAAIAQEAAEDDNLEVIEVRATSYADSLAKALLTKRDSAGSVDTILAEDIADFPDQNLAEALQRLPGIAITREAGEGRGISVRGLNETFTRVQLNGMQAQSLAAGTGGVQTNRGFDFNVFASELFNSLTVHKTTDASLEEGSLGATVSLRTARPFDFNEDVVAVNAQGSYNDQSTDFSPRLSGLASYTNDDDTFGVLVSASLSERIVNNVGADTGRWNADPAQSAADEEANASAAATCSACTSASDYSAVSNALHPRFPRMADKTHDQQRLGLTASVQFIPSDSTLVSVDLLYANIDSTRNEPFMEAISLARTNSTGMDQSDFAAYQIDANNTMYAATIADVDVRSEYFVADWESEFTQASVSLQHDFADDLRMNLLAGSSKSVLDNRESTVIYEHYSFNDSRKMGTYAESASAVTYDMSDMLNPTLSYNFDTTNPANWELSEFRDRVYDAESSTDNARVDFAYMLNDEVTLKAGATYKSYGYEIAGTRADRSFSSADASDGEDGSACGVGFEVTSSDGSVVNVGGQQFFMADRSKIASLGATGCWPAAVRAGDTRSVDEESVGFFAQADFNVELGDNILRGNAGVRHVTTDVSSTGLQSGSVEVTVEHDYSDTLPSVNLAYELGDDIVLRGSWAKVMSRPNLTTLNPGGSVSIFGTYGVRYGNPFIKPFRADALDFAAEWYFDEGAVLSVAYFSKDIESFPKTDTIEMSWAETGLPNSLLGSELENAIDQTFEVRTTVNGDGGELDGFEVQYQQQLDFLPGPEWMKKFGVIANMTFVDSKVIIGEEDGQPLYGRLLGQSDTSSNFTLYWEDEAFSARISMANRGDYDTHYSRELYVDESTHVDMSASYKFSDNLKLTVEGINLTDEATTLYQVPGVARVVTDQNTGRQFVIGVSYRM